MLLPVKNRTKGKFLKKHENARVSGARISDASLDQSCQIIELN